MENLIIINNYRWTVHFLRMTTDDSRDRFSTRSYPKDKYDVSTHVPATKTIQE